MMAVRMLKIGTIYGVLFIISAAQVIQAGWVEWIPKSTRCYVPEEVKPSTKSSSNTQNATGSVSIENALKKEPMTIYGTLTSKQSTFEKSLSVYGPINYAYKSIFQDNVNVYGPADFEQCSFEKDITIYGKLELKDCSTKNVIIEKDKKGKVTLRGSTKVGGSITFKNKPGTVYLYDTAEVTGSVINGKMVDKRPKK